MIKLLLTLIFILIPPKEFIHFFFVHSNSQPSRCFLSDSKIRNVYHLDNSLSLARFFLRKCIQNLIFKVVFGMKKIFSLEIKYFLEK